MPEGGTTLVASLVSDPAEGNTILLGILATSAHATPPVGFVNLTGFLRCAPGEVGLEVYAHVVEAGEDGAYTLGFSAEWWIAEFTPLDSLTPVELVTAIDQTSANPTVSLDPGSADPVLVIGAWLKKPGVVATTDADGDWVWGAARQQVANTIGFGFVYDEFPDGMDPYDPGVTDAGGSGSWSFAGIVFDLGETPPEEPPIDPGWSPPLPGRAILEIYVHDEDASEWDTATWATGPATGTEGIWSGAGWQDITPQGVMAHIIWGARTPERGILARQDAASWDVMLYDPDRALDPGNEDGPYHPQIVSGVPIRISHAQSGRVIRTGVVDRWTYAHKSPDYQGRIAATDSIALLHRTDVPEDSILGNTLDERIADVIVASGIAVGGIPLAPGFGHVIDAPLSDRIEGPATAWEHIYRACEEALNVPYIAADGGLEARMWGAPLDRGSDITYENLEDLEAISSQDGVYSVVYVTNVDGTAVIERVAAPLPRYGRIAYTRDETTIDPEAWADAVLADRAWPGVLYKPGVAWCFTAADVDFFGSLEIMERVTITYPGVVSVTGRLLGMELWVEAKDSDEARWKFLPHVATDGSTALATTMLVTDGTGDFMVDDATETDYLVED